MKREIVWKINLTDPITVICATVLAVEDIMPLWMWIVTVILCAGASAIMAEVEKGREVKDEDSTAD